MIWVLIAVIVVHSWYPQWCCGSQDCHPVPCSEITITKDTVAVLQSLDEQCHACDHLGTGGFHHRYCVFIPQAVS